MFTGIVQELGSIVFAQSGKLEITADKVLKGVELGGSIAVNGACLTVTRFGKKSFLVDITPETVKRTNLGNLSAGDKVNLERPLAIGGELGGHLVQGHVDATGTIAEITRDGTALVVKLEAPPKVMQYVVEKGFIAIDGVSLTVVDIGDRYFRVSITIGFIQCNLCKIANENATIILVYTYPLYKITKPTKAITIRCWTRCNYNRTSIALLY